MKNFKRILFSVLLMTLVLNITTSCDDEVAESTKQFIPLFTLNGEELVYVTQGSDWVDPGASATEGPTELEVTVDGTVDLDNYGVYPVTYSATGSRGETFSASRTVVVTPDPDDITGNSIAGNYQPLTGPVACGIVNEMLEVAPGAYFFDWYGDRSDCIDGDIFCYIFCLDGVNLESPLQPIPANIFGQTSSVGSGTYNTATNIFSIDVTIYSAGATLNRVWQKI